MHTDLAPHLHSSECNELIEALQNCHTENAIGKFLGVCNSVDAALLKCLKKERIARSAANRAKARTQQEEVRERVRESNLNL